MQNALSPTRIKVCCIANPDEASAAIDAGADALGLVSAMPSGPGVIALPLIAEICRAVAGRVETFLLTCAVKADEIIAAARTTGCSTLQLCDAVDSSDTYAAIRSALPAVKIVQVIHVEDEIALDEAFRAQEHADALLLDSGRPNAAIKELGGTGRAHDWTLSHRIVGASKVPVWLAGGLNESNVGRAIRDVTPFGLDVCSGVRTDGRLDPQKLSAFVSAARAADGDR